MARGIYKAAEEKAERAEKPKRAAKTGNEEKPQGARRRSPKADEKEKTAKAAGTEKPKDGARRRAAKTDSAVPGRESGRSSRAGKPEENEKPDRNTQSRRTAKEKQRQDAVYRDRRRAVSRAVASGVRMAALLTALFEALGLALIAMRSGSMDAQALRVAAALVPLGLVTTLILPRFLPVDAPLMALVNFLCGVGIVILYTVSPSRGVRQLVFYAAGLVGMLIISGVVSHVRRWGFLTFAAMALGIGALVLPLLFGQWSGGAKSWVSLPLIGSFQPSELVKICVVLALAYYFSTHRTFFQMLPAILFVVSCLALLMLQRDLGTALIYYATTLALFYAACGNLPLTLAGLAGGCGAAYMGYALFAHVKVRVAMWRNPWSDPLDKGYQIIQALLAIGSGGLFGVGLGKGTPEKIPAYFNDFIFAVVCEQLGLVFGLLLLGCYALLIVRGLYLASRSRRSFDLLLGSGVCAMLGIQTLMIVGGVIKMIPLTGVTMPFLSYGGSSLLSCLMMVGVLHGIGARAQEDCEEEILLLRD